MSNFAGNNRIEIPGNFAIEEAGKLREELYGMIAQGKVNFTMDFSNCEFIDSTGLGVLVGVYKKCAEQKGSIKLYNISPKVMKVFNLTRLDKVFEIQ